MSRYISKEHMAVLGKHIEKTIDPDKEYFLMVTDKPANGRIFQYIKNVPIIYFVQYTIDFFQRIKQSGITDTPSDN